MRYYIIAIAVSLLVLGILKISNIVFTKRLKKHIFNEQENIQENIGLIVENVSYKKYKNVARRTSVRNSPQRKNGNFMDFLFVNISEDVFAIENNLSGVDCGEFYE